MPRWCCEEKGGFCPHPLPRWAAVPESVSHGQHNSQESRTDYPCCHAAGITEQIDPPSGINPALIATDKARADPQLPGHKVTKAAVSPQYQHRAIVFNIRVFFPAVTLIPFKLPKGSDRNSSPFSSPVVLVSFCSAHATGLTPTR